MTKRVLSQIITGTPSLLGRMHPDTINYQNRIRAKGASIRREDLLAVDRFVKEVYANGLRSLLLDVSPLAGDSLAAALTKLWNPTGVPSDLTNNNFVSGDYSREAGLQGNGMTKYLDTGFIPSNFLVQSASLGVYTRSTTAENGADISAGSYGLFSRWGDSIAYFDCYNSTAGQGRASVSIADSRGLITGSRLNATDSKIYRNTTQIATIATSGGSAPNTSTWYYAFNNAGMPLFLSTKAQGFFFCGLGLTGAQVSTLHRLVQNLMTAFGRAV